MTTSGAQQGIRPGVCLSTSRPASPYIGQVIYMTDVNVSAVWDGTSWSGLDRSRDRNEVINGSMQVHQRGTSRASVTGEGYYTADRWQSPTNTGTWTHTIENDAPTGSGFRKSLRVLCTTANASPGATAENQVRTIIEGQNIQAHLKGTASARQFALSFWVKSNVTGTYIAELYDADNNRQVSLPYTISASGVWEKETIIFPADTVGLFDNDNGNSLYVIFWTTAGSNLASGTLNTSWGNAVTANRAVGQVNVASAINNYWQVTGVQLEAGPVATPFEFEDIGTTLAKCQRYYYRISGVRNFGAITAQTATKAFGAIPLPVSMRVPPTAIDFNTLRTFDLFNGALAISGLVPDGSSSSETIGAVDVTSSGMTGFRTYYIIQNGATSFLGFSAEL